MERLTLKDRRIERPLDINSCSHIGHTDRQEKPKLEKSLRSDTLPAFVFVCVVSEQRRVRCPFPCPVSGTLRCRGSVSAACLAALCVMLLIVIGMLSVINGYLRSICLNQTTDASYTHLQLHSESTCTPLHTVRGLTK